MTYFHRLKIGINVQYLLLLLLLLHSQSVQYYGVINANYTIYVTDFFFFSLLSFFTAKLLIIYCRIENLIV